MLIDFNSVDLAFHEKVAETSKVKLNYMAAKHHYHIMFTHNLIKKKKKLLYAIIDFFVTFTKP